MENQNKHYICSASVYAHEISDTIKMNKQNTRIRIKDIARLAGVSEGTVDRVLHNRGEVSAQSREAVEQILKEINYTPNYLARSLAIKKQLRLVCLVPSFQIGEYWERVVNGFKLAQSDYQQYHIDVQIQYFNQYDVNSFIDETNKILTEAPDIVIFSPTFRDESLKFIQDLSERNIAFSFVDSMLENTAFLTYYGQNSFQSGFAAARLLFEGLPQNTVVLVVLTRSIGELSNQTLSRLEGFLQFIEKNNLNVGIKYIELSSTDIENNQRKLKTIFSENNNISAAITFNSKVYQLVSCLEKLEIRNLKVAGYDLLDRNVAYLKKGLISFLIAQRPGKQAYLSVRDVCTSLIFKQPVKKINYVPIDILISENIDSYTEFNE